MRPVEERLRRRSPTALVAAVAARGTGYPSRSDSKASTCSPVLLGRDASRDASKFYLKRPCWPWLTSCSEVGPRSLCALGLIELVSSPLAHWRQPRLFSDAPRWLIHGASPVAKSSLSSPSHHVQLARVAFDQCQVGFGHILALLAVLSLPLSSFERSSGQTSYMSVKRRAGVVERRAPRSRQRLTWCGFCRAPNSLTRRRTCLGQIHGQQDERARGGAAHGKVEALNNTCVLTHEIATWVKSRIRRELCRYIMNDVMGTRHGFRVSPHIICSGDLLRS